MGGAKYLGRDPGIPRTKGIEALEIVWYWLIGGLPILFFLSILVFPEPNFIVPILVYLFGVIFLVVNYIRIEMKDEN